jgi:hypothetical protein
VFFSRRRPVGAGFRFLSQAINHYRRELVVRRVALPRILIMPEIKEIAADIPCEIETSFWAIMA